MEFGAQCVMIKWISWMLLLPADSLASAIQVIIDKAILNYYDDKDRPTLIGVASYFIIWIVSII